MTIGDAKELERLRQQDASNSHRKEVDARRAEIDRRIPRRSGAWHQAKTELAFSIVAEEIESRIAIRKEMIGLCPDLMSPHESHQFQEQSVFIESAFQGILNSFSTIGIRPPASELAQVSAHKQTLKQRVHTALGMMQLEAPQKASLAPPIKNDAASVYSMNNYRFKIALSFPGEYRARVQNIATLLSASIVKSEILYDRWHAAEFARPNLDVYLPSLYREQSLLLVFFFCAAYAKKQWCGLEWRVGRDLLKQMEDHRLMLLRFDDGEIPGIYSIDGYLDIQKLSDSEVAAAILNRLRLLLPAGNTSLGASFNKAEQPIVENEQTVAKVDPALGSSPPSAAIGQPTPIRKPILQLRPNGEQRLFEPPLDNTWARISLELANVEYKLPSPAHDVRASMAFLQPGSGRRPISVQRCFFLMGRTLQPTVRSLPNNEPCEVVLAYTNDGKKFWAASSHTPSTSDTQYHLESAFWRCKVKVQSNEVSVSGVFELMLWDDRPIEVQQIPECSQVEHNGGMYYDCNFCTLRFGSEEGVLNHLTGCGC